MELKCLSNSMWISSKAQTGLEVGSLWFIPSILSRLQHEMSNGRFFFHIYGVFWHQFSIVLYLLTENGHCLLWNCSNIYSSVIICKTAPSIKRNRCILFRFDTVQICGLLFATMLSVQFALKILEIGHAPVFHGREFK